MYTYYGTKIILYIIMVCLFSSKIVDSKYD